MKRTIIGSVLVLFVLIGFSLCYGSTADGLDARIYVRLEGILLRNGMNWETAVCKTIMDGANAKRVIETALFMNGDLDGIIKGAECANVSIETIQNALDWFYSRAGECCYGKSESNPLSPVLPTYSGGGGGGRTSASPFR